MPASTDNSPIEKVQSLFADLSVNDVTEEHFATVYSREIRFLDPAHEVRGLSALVAYSQSMYANVNYCRFDFARVIEDDGVAVLFWTMTLSHPKLQRGQPISVTGNSLIKFSNGLVDYHRDYFDLGAMIYERIPVVGHVIKRIKAGLAQ